MLALAAVLAGAYLGLDAGTGLGRTLDSLGLALLAPLALLLGSIAGAWGLRLLRGLLTVLPLRLLGLAATAFFLLQAFWHIADRRVWWLSLGIVLLEALFGAAVGLALTSGRRRAAVWSVLAVGLVANGFFLAWFFGQGSVAHLLMVPPYQEGPQIDAPDPAEPGPLRVANLTYGSGTDRRRPEYGAEADLQTQPVGANAFVRVDGFNDWARRRYWGFGPEAFPLNGRVWYPEGPGPYPLLLMVHGNHDMNDYSDAGYQYLGEHLASHGYIFVSVDENFLNAYVTGTIGGEMDARAWLLLEHLRQWAAWATDETTPFAGRVDMDQVVLLGHSRGGEAAALATAYNGLSHNPDNALRRWRYNFGIRGVIALAPTDQRLRPAGAALPLTDVNYLVLHGAHDADVSEFTGLRQYQRVTFTEAAGFHFKAALSIYQANHAQFNTDWGERDLGEPRGTLLNHAPLMDGADQRRVARLYLTAFLAVTLRHEAAYLPLFQDYRAAGTWLPPTLYVSQYQDSGWRPVATFEEDIDVTTVTLVGGGSEAAGLTRWREEALSFREGREQDNRAVRLGWGHSGAGRYTLTLPPGLAPATTLTFNAADLREEAAAADLDFHIRLADTAGNEVTRPLSDFQTLLPPRPLRVTRLFTWEEGSYGGPSQILQTVMIPLAAFAPVDPAQLERITLLFDRTAPGSLLLDDIGLGSSPATLAAVAPD